MNKVLLFANDYTTILNFRMELIEKLVLCGYKVQLALPKSDYDEFFRSCGCEIYHISIDRKGKNPFKDLKLIKSFKNIVKRINPDIVLTFTIKPNVYGGIVCKRLNKPFIANITGLGTAVENEGIMQKITLFLYRKGLKNANMVFFQNEANRDFMLKNKISGINNFVIPGSGVNLSKFSIADYPTEDVVNFVFVARVMKEKGIEQFLDAANKLHSEKCIFHICGKCDENYSELIKRLDIEGVIKYHGVVRNMPEIYKMSSCIVHPSYYPEGMSNVLLESAATGRPVITTNRPGCREIVDDGINGYIVEAKKSDDLIEKLEKFLSLSIDDRKKMGLAARKKVEKQFDRNIVIDKYMEVIRGILKE